MTMPTKDTVFQRKFLNASDLKGQPVVVTIKDAPLQKLKNGSGEEQQKTVLYFLGKTKGLPLNLTNWDSVADVTGENDSDNWRGHKIELYPTTTDMKGKTVECIRVRAPAQRELPTKPKPEPAPSPASEPDYDDNIPF
jgi:hypothetical protein